MTPPDTPTVDVDQRAVSEAERSGEVRDDAPTVWIVEGSAGEYSDRREWPVVVVQTEDDAKAYVTALQRQYQQIPQSWWDWRYEHEEDMQRIMSLDPGFQSDYTGTSYYYGEVKLLSSDRVAAAVHTSFVSPQQNDDRSDGAASNE